MRTGFVNNDVFARAQLNICPTKFVKLSKENRAILFFLIKRNEHDTDVSRRILYCGYFYAN